MEGGKMITVERQLDKDYSSLTVEGAFDLQLVDNENYDIRIECPENLLPYIVTNVNDGELYITEKSNHVNANNRGTIYVNKSYLTRLRNEGSGNVRGHLETSDHLDIINIGSGNIQLNASSEDHIFIDNEGSGNIAIDGTTKDIIIKIDGSGNVDALYLYTENGDVTINGSGNSLVNCSESLLAHINGSGNVLYLGNPIITVTVTGSGEIKPY
jgi:hypothetical protein